VRQEELLAKYRFALEQSLAKAHFLNTTELMVVQAFVLFLWVVRRVDDSRFCWSLTTLVVRIAQGMGLQRDGTGFDLTPFETEMRRRVWWAILSLDLRSAEEVGTDLIIHDCSNFDTRLPLNIDDAEISPTSTSFPEPHEGRSDTAVSLVRYEILMLSRRFMVESMSRGTVNITDREEVLKDVYRRIEQKFLKHVVDETDPLYWMVAMVTRIIMAKMCLFTYQSQMFPGTDGTLSDEIRQRIYISSIEIVELGHILNSDPRCKQYRWLFQTYTNWHAIAFALLETCRRPWTALVERAWQAVIRFDRDPVELAKSSDHAAIFLPLRKLFLRGRRHRQSEILRLSANLDEARKLDFQERMNPAESRFGPIPGAESTAEEWRKKWLLLIRPDGPGLEPWTMSRSSVTGDRTPASGGAPSEAYGASSNPPEMEFPSEAMEYMTDLMTGPDLSVSMLLPLNNLAQTHDGSQYRIPQGGISPNPNAQLNIPPNSSLSQQAMALQERAAGVKDDNAPPYLWPGAYEDPLPPKLDDGMGELDMMENDFNWHDWTQSLQNFGVDGAAMPPP
jgi:hypothetical protein